MSLSPIRQRYLDDYPIKFTRTIRPPIWFWLGLGLCNLPDNISDADLKAKALKAYEVDKDELEDERRALIEDIYIKAYPYKEDHDEGTPWWTMEIKKLTLDMSEEEVIARALSDYEADKSVIESLDDYYQKMKDNEEE